MYWVDQVTRLLLGWCLIASIGVIIASVWGVASTMAGLGLSIFLIVPVCLLAAILTAVIIVSIFVWIIGSAL